MARLSILGAETGHIHAEDVSLTGTTQTFDTSVKRTGTRAFKFDSSAACYLQQTVAGPLDTRLFITAWVYFPTATGYPGSNSRILVANTGTPAVVASLRVTTAGKLQLLNSAGTQIGSDSSETMALDTWHRIDLGVETRTGATDYAEGRLNGVSIASTTTGNFTDNGIANFQFGWIDDPGTSEVLYVDDVVVNSEAGLTNNTWALDEKVVLLLPTADSEVDGWAQPDGGTTSLFEAVNNIPPAGLDSGAATDTSQI
jgi:hypothetical protein